VHEIAYLVVPLRTCQERPAWTVPSPSGAFPVSSVASVFLAPFLRKQQSTRNVCRDGRERPAQFVGNTVLVFPSRFNKATDQHKYIWYHILRQLSRCWCGDKDTPSWGMLSSPPPKSMKLQNQYIVQRVDTKDIIRQLQNSASLSHPHIATLYGMCIDEERGVFLVLENMTGGCLFDKLRSHTFNAALKVWFPFPTPK